MPLTATGFQRPLTGYTLTQAHNAPSQFLYDTDASFEYHVGEDWANGSFGGAVLAAANGTVVYAAPASGWGNLVMIEHTLPDGSIVTSIYGHLQAISVSSGDVTIGQQIGTVGNGGFSTGPHLHFSIFLGDRNGLLPIGLVHDNPDADPFKS